MLYAVQCRINKRLEQLAKMNVQVCQSPYELFDVYGAIGDRQHNNYVEIVVCRDTGLN